MKNRIKFNTDLMWNCRLLISTSNVMLYHHEHFHFVFKVRLPCTLPEQPSILTPPRILDVFCLNFEENPGSQSAFSFYTTNHLIYLQQHVLVHMRKWPAACVGLTHSQPPPRSNWPAQEAPWGTVTKWRLICPGLKWTSENRTSWLRVSVTLLVQRGRNE